MKVVLLVFGKTDESWIETGIQKYRQRLMPIIQFEMKVIPEPKNHGKLPIEEQKAAEEKLFLKEITPYDDLVILDEIGKSFTSPDFAQFVEKRLGTGKKRLVFATGGPYGFTQAVRLKANTVLSLSCMTFTHQMVRLVFTEQLYRAFTIIRGEPYHH